MSPNSNVISNILGGSHIGTLLGSAGWGLKTLFAAVFLVALVALIISITKLASSGDNPGKRQDAIRNILISGICIACLGSVGLVFLVFVGFM